MSPFAAFLTSMALIVFIALLQHWSIKKGTNHWLALGSMIGSFLIGTIISILLGLATLGWGILSFVLLSIGAGIIIILLNPSKV